MARKKYPLIGLSGRARVGKDTAANMVTAMYGGYQYSFADPIKEMLRAGLGIDLRSPYWLNRKEEAIPAIGRSPRELMQTLGTEWGLKHVHPQLWILMAQQYLLNKGPGMVLSDVRTENEAVWVRELGGRIIHIKRADADVVKDHVTEQELMIHDSDFLIRNDGTLEDLRDRIRVIFGDD